MDFGKTYLYKLHKLTHTLDRAFDRTLRNHTEIGLSQLSLLHAVGSFGSVNQQRLANFLDVTTPAVSRQVDIARRMGWVEVSPSLTDRHGNSLTLTKQGQALVEKSIGVLEQHLFKVFTDHNKQANLMQHIDLLLNHTQEVINEQRIYTVKHRSNVIKIRERI